ncbi:MAG: hypothetical protein JXN64_01285 [Spirochaetes bacterium]|nr:hypothetical protein [Spirochaetota bacterium]
MTKQEDKFAEKLPPVLKFLWILLRWHKIELLIGLVLILATLFLIMVYSPEAAEAIRNFLLNKLK